MPEKFVNALKEVCFQAENVHFQLRNVYFQPRNVYFQPGNGVFKLFCQFFPAVLVIFTKASDVL